MRLERIRILRMPGIDGPFGLDEHALGPGLHIVLGPNGSGKTTLHRAVQALLWPETSAVPSPQVTARFRIAGQSWTASRDGRMPPDWRDGEGRSRRPSLPPASLAHCYVIGVHELVKTGADEGDAHLGKELRRQLAGGYDVDAVLADYRTRPRLGDAELRDAEAAQRAVVQTRSAQRELAEAEDDLEQLRLRRDELSGAERRIALLERLGVLHETRALLALARQRIEQMPPVLAELDGSELDQVEQLEADIASSVEETGLIAVARTRSEAALRDLGLPLGPLQPLEITARRRQVRDLEARAAELERAEARAFEASIVERTARAALDPDATDAAPCISSDLLERAGRYLNERQAVRGAYESTERWLRLLERPIRRAPDLAFGPTRIALVAATGLAAVGVTLGLSLHAAWFVLALAGAALAGIAATARRRAGALARRELVRHRELEAEQCHADLDKLRADLDELDAEGRALRDATGIDYDVGELAFVDLLRRLGDFAAAQRKHTVAAQRLAVIAADHGAALAEIGDFVTGQGFGAPADAATARELVEEIVRRSDLLRDAEERREESIERLRFETERRRALEERRAVLLARAACDDVDELRGLLAVLDDWRMARRELDRLTVLSDEIEAELEPYPDIARLPHDAVAHQIEAETRNRVEFMELAERIGAVDHEVTRVTHAGQLEEAIASAAAAQDALERRRDQALHEAAGRFLLETVRSEHRQSFEPDVLARASRLFETFTEHGYELRVHDDAPCGFVAYDTQQAATRRLGELSDGTRAQLLLAVRLAFAFEAEGQDPMPLFLDESLAHCDAGRFAVIARSLLLLAAQEDRQIFYLTSDAADVRRFERAARDKAAAVRSIDLGVVRGLERSSAEPADYVLPRPAAVPEPGRMTPEEYAARLRVPHFDPRLAGTSTHLWHLMRDDLAGLHRLLSARVPTLGQWRSLRGLGLPAADLTETQAALLDVRGELLEAFVAAWRIGRGRRVDRAVLEASSAVSLRFIDQVSNLAERCNGAAEQLLAELRAGAVKRFRSDATVALESYLAREGYVDERDPLAEDAVRARVLEALARHVEAGLITAAEIGHDVAAFWTQARGAASPAT